MALLKANECNGLIHTEQSQSHYNISFNKHSTQHAPLSVQQDQHLWGTSNLGVRPRNHWAEIVIHTHKDINRQTW